MPGYVFSPEFQRDILRLVVADPSFLFQFRRALDPDFFTEPEHVTIAHAILDTFDKVGEPPDVGLLLEAYKPFLDAGLDSDEVEDEIRAVCAEGIPRAAEEVSRRVVEFGRHQRLRNLLLDSQSYLDEGRYDEFEDAVREVSLLSGDADAAVYDYFDRLTERLAASSTRAGEAIGTGITSIDIHLQDGGIAPGEMGLLLGLPGYGKTTSLITFGANALRSGHRVFHATIGDMTSRKVGLRYDANLMGQTIPKCRLNPQVTRDTIEALLGASGGTGRLKIEFWPAYRATVADLERKLRWLAARFAWRPDLLIVDYGANLLPRSGFNRRDAIWERHEEIYKDLRALGATIGARVWTAIQANREAWQAMREDRPITQENTAGSLGPMRDADVAISINMTKAQRDDGIIRYHGAKVREGQAEWMEECSVDFTTHTVKASDAFTDDGDDPDVKPPRRRSRGAGEHLRPPS